MRAARALLAGRGLVFSGDERTEDTFIAPASETERIFYGFGVFHSLPGGNGRGRRGGHGHRVPGRNGPPLRRRRRFSTCEVLPIENDFWRFYLLRL